MGPGCTGRVLGRSLDADELNIYREFLESSLSKWKRNASTVAVGLLSVVAIVAVDLLGGRTGSGSRGM